MPDLSPSRLWPPTAFAQNSCHLSTTTTMEWGLLSPCLPLQPTWRWFLKIFSSVCLSLWSLSPSLSLSLRMYIIICHDYKHTHSPHSWSILMKMRIFWCWGPSRTSTSPNSSPTTSLSLRVSPLTCSQGWSYLNQTILYWPRPVRRSATEWTSSVPRPFWWEL